MWGFFAIKLLRTFVLSACNSRFIRRLLKPPPIDLEKVPLLAASSLTHHDKPSYEGVRKPSLFKVMFFLD